MCATRERSEIRKDFGREKIIKKNTLQNWV